MLKRIMDKLAGAITVGKTVRITTKSSANYTEERNGLSLVRQPNLAKESQGSVEWWIDDPPRWQSDCWHHNGERALPTDFRQCLECGHSYRTAQDLIDAYYSESPGSYDTPPGQIRVEDIFFCPFCIHDF